MHSRLLLTGNLIGNFPCKGFQTPPIFTNWKKGRIKIKSTRKVKLKGERSLVTSTESNSYPSFKINLIFTFYIGTKSTSTIPRLPFSTVSSEKLTICKSKKKQRPHRGQTPHAQSNCPGVSPGGGTGPIPTSARTTNPAANTCLIAHCSQLPISKAQCSLSVKCTLTRCYV